MGYWKENTRALWTPDGEKIGVMAISLRGATRHFWMGYNSFEILLRFKSCLANVQSQYLRLEMVDTIATVWTYGS
jgi:hypothetical protein